MNGCPEEIILYMQEYLDSALPHDKEQILKEHLQTCPDCQAYFQELKRTVAYVKSVEHIKVSDQFTANVMAALPKESNSVGVKRFLRHHPFLAAASLFLILMAASMFHSWNGDNKLTVTMQPNLIIENETVIVPEGEIVEGDITVRNGNIRVEGKVDGNITVINGEIINGEQFLASAGSVTGEIEEINKLFDWIWYNIKDLSKKLINFFEES